MPNWCFNNLKISASPTQIQSLMQKAKGPESPELTEHVPFSMLPFVEHLISEDYETNWYNENCELLGCKWFPEIVKEDIEVYEDFVLLRFETPWAPSTDATRHIANWLLSQGHAFRIEHSYEEFGEAFCGLLTIDNDDESEEMGHLYEIFGDDMSVYDDHYLQEIAAEFDTTVDEIKQAAKTNGSVRFCPDFYTASRDALSDL